MLLSIARCSTAVDASLVLFVSVAAPTTAGADSEAQASLPVILMSHEELMSNLASSRNSRSAPSVTYVHVLVCECTLRANFESLNDKHAHDSLQNHAFSLHRNAEKSGIIGRWSWHDTEELPWAFRPEA